MEVSALFYQANSDFPHVVTPERVLVQFIHRDGNRLHWVDRFLDLAYPGTFIYALYRATQHPYFEYFLAEELPDILVAVLGVRLILAWWCWKKITVIFTPTTLFIRNGLRSYSLDAGENYGFSSSPHQDRKLRKSRFLQFTHHILIEHRTQGSMVLGNVFGELMAKQIVDKLQGLKSWVQTLEVKEPSGREVRL